MFYNEEWIAVCADGTGYDKKWNNQAVWVVCRQLGHYGGKATFLKTLSVEGDWKVDDVRCGDGIHVFLVCCLFVCFVYCFFYFIFFLFKTKQEISSFS